jgi:hypothetical protein
MNSIARGVVRERTVESYVDPVLEIEFPTGKTLVVTREAGTGTLDADGLERQAHSREAGCAT